MSDDLIAKLAAIARQIEARELRDASDEIEAILAVLAGRTKPIHQSIFDAAVALAPPISVTTATKLAYSINHAQTELGIDRLIRAGTNREN